MAGLPKEYSVLVTIVGASKTEYTLEEIGDLSDAADT